MNSETSGRSERFAFPTGGIPCLGGRLGIRPARCLISVLHGIEKRKADTIGVAQPASLFPTGRSQATANTKLPRSRKCNHRAGEQRATGQP
jgi:hypothetical protein